MPNNPPYGDPKNDIEDKDSILRDAVAYTPPEQGVYLPMPELNQNLGGEMMDRGYASALQTAPNPIIAQAANNPQLVPEKSNNPLLSTINQAQGQQQQDILRLNPQEQAMINAQKAALAPGTVALSNQQLMPGLNQPIRVGGYSGSIVGSNDIFVPTGDVYGWEGDLAQRKAQEAAVKAQNEIGKKWAPLQAKELTDKRFQEGILKSSNQLTDKFLEDIQAKYGADAKFVMENPEQYKEGRDYARKMSALNLHVDRGNQILTELADIRTSIDSGAKIYSDETLKDLNEYEDLWGRFENGDSDALLEMEPLLARLQGGKNIDKYLKDQGVLTGIKGEVLGGTSIGSAGYEGYAKLSTSDKEIFDKNIENLVDGWIAPGGAFRDEVNKGLVDRESLTKRLRGSLQNKVQRKTTISNVGGSGSGKKDVAASELDGRPNNKDFKNPDGTVSTYSMSNETKVPTTDHRISTSGLQMIDANGRTAPIEGVKDLQIVSFNTIANDKFQDGQSRFVDFQDKDDIPVVVARYEKEVPEMKYSEGEEKLIPTGKMTTEVVEIPVVFDETLAKAIDADASQLKLTEGSGTKAYEKYKYNNSSSKSTKNINGVEYSKEELINFAKEAGKTTKEAEDLWNQQ